MASAQIPGDLVHYANVASQIRDGWTLKQAERALEALQRAETAQGGRDYYGAIRRIRKQILANIDAQWLPELKAHIESRRPAPQIIPPMSATGSSTRSTPWKMEDFDLGFQSGSRNSLMGKAAFSQAGCIHCHRQGGEGGDLGPDLSQLGRRMDRRAILESIIHPSKVIDEKYQLTNLTLRDDTELSGLVIREDSRTLRLAAGTWGDMESDVAVADIERRQLSEISPMPEGLLDGLGREQILDLLSFLETVPAAQ
ncbi:MAG: c-type cytochrome [Verrucomicrobia bacterium]|nr:c-type cytochrome [Verrucomicrobiota bacterium]